MLRGSFIFSLALCFSSVGMLACSSGPDVYVRKDFKQPRPCKVAVFPLHNNTNIAEASEIVTAALIARLVEAGRFQVEFPGNVRSFLVGERIVVRTGVDLNTIQLMGKRLGLDAVVLGQVDEYVGAGEGARSVVPVVSISARLVDVKTGKIVFMAQERKTGDDYITVLDFGKVRSVGELAKKVVGDIVEAMP